MIIIARFSEGRFGGKASRAAGSGRAASASTQPQTISAIPPTKILRNWSGFNHSSPAPVAMGPRIIAGTIVTAAERRWEFGNCSGPLPAVSYAGGVPNGHGLKRPAFGRICLLYPYPLVDETSQLRSFVCLVCEKAVFPATVADPLAPYSSNLAWDRPAGSPGVSP